MNLFHDSRDVTFRNPTGAQACGSLVRIRIRIEEETPDAVHLRTWFGKESFTPMRPVGTALYEADLIMPETPCLLWYDFQVWKDGQFFWYGNAEDCLGGVGSLVYGQARSYQITVYDPSFQTPAWLENAVFYQIFPDRFAKCGEALPMEGRVLHANWNEQPFIMDEEQDNFAHDFFGGNLAGIRQKLPYIAALGVNAIYLNPIFFAMTNHRFDTTDWHQVDPYLGTGQDFLELVQEAEALGIRIILDGVFNHAGNHNSFFQHAKEDIHSPYRNWFLFEHWPDMYKSWWGFHTLPEIDKCQPEVIEYFVTGRNSVVQKWLRNGASGWRIDVADELPMPYLRLIRDAVKQIDENRYLLGEVWEDASNKISYGQMRSYCLGDTMDGVMNYPLCDAAVDFLLNRIDAYVFKRRMDSLYENYPEPFAHGLLNIVSSHDKPRILNTLAEKDGGDLTRAEQGKLSLSNQDYLLGKARVKLMLMLILAMPGAPCIYYGDEIGMQGAFDPYNRGTYPWGDGDEELLHFFQNAISIRKANETFSRGRLIIQAHDSDVLAIHRSMGSYTYTTVINRSREKRTIETNKGSFTIEGLSFLQWESENDSYES